MHKALHPRNDVDIIEKNEREFASIQRSRLCGERDEKINLIINECSKLAQKEYKTRHDWVAKVIHWELCKQFKFNLTNKWYMHNPDPVLENELHKLLWVFEIQTNHLILARRPDIVIIVEKKTKNNNKKTKQNQAKTKQKQNKKFLPNCGLCWPDWRQNQIWRKGNER